MKTRRAAPRALAALAIAIALQAARPAAAQPPGVEHDGLMHAALGNATLALNPATGDLEVDNLGSSGQDGIEIQNACGAGGYGLEWGNYAAEFVPGTSYSVALRGRLASGGEVETVRLTTIEAQGFETLIVDFSGIHPSPAMFRVELLDNSGVVVASRDKPVQSGWDMKVTHTTLASAYRGSHPAPAGTIGVVQEGVRLYSRGGTGYQNIEVRYVEPVLVEDGPYLDECTTIRLTCATGEAVSETMSFSLTGTWPAASDPGGTITIASESIDLKCVGTGCATATSGAVLHALGQALFHNAGAGGCGGGGELDNIGSSGNDGVGLDDPISKPKKKIKASMKMPPPGPSDPATVHFDARGIVNGNDQRVARVACANSSHSVMTADFSPLGASGYQLRLLRSGGAVAEVVDPPSGVDVDFASDAFTAGFERSAAGALLFRIVCVTSPCPGWPVVLGPSVYIADEIVFEPAGMPAPGAQSFLAVDDLESLEVRAAGSGPIAILGAEVVPENLPSAVDDRNGAIGRTALHVFPNPGRSAQRVTFALARAGRARVAVVDVAGRCVRRLADAPFTAGDHTLAWDGRSDAGRATPAGIYFVRVESGESRAVARVTRVR